MAVIIALILIALIVTAVICMLRKPAMPTQGAVGGVIVPERRLAGWGAGCRVSSRRDG